MTWVKTSPSAALPQRIADNQTSPGKASADLLSIIALKAAKTPPGLVTLTRMASQTLSLFESVPQPIKVAIAELLTDSLLVLIAV